ncbi:hypothetical protein [Caulobacter sp. BP25]|uniref:hypothetical protein n=1 Tax=Caulobacter sp. BP25 TaxID=2048900 RepID=UPI000C12AD0F|nr:hypothetical protein [Caulobacter sp. BP25]PHY18849.1 hypothetical protein CSW59_10395 [Caulobacter sp. BP25]
MDLSVFRQRLSALGADIGRWPDGDEAVALLAASDEAVALLADALEDVAPEDGAKRDDALLDPGLTDAIMDAAIGRKTD